MTPEQQRMLMLMQISALRNMVDALARQTDALAEVVQSGLGISAAVSISEPADPELPGACQHPLDKRKPLATFDDAAQTMCILCSEVIPGRTEG